MMCVFLPQMQRAFQDAIETGDGFTVLDIRNRVRELCGPSIPVDYKTVKYELLALFEKNRPDGWVATTKQVTDIEGNPQRVWYFVRLRKMLEAWEAALR